MGGNLAATCTLEGVLVRETISGVVVFKPETDFGVIPGHLFQNVFHRIAIEDRSQVSKGIPLQ
jgi:hypothetical protein